MKPQSNIKISFIQIFLIVASLSLQSQTVSDYDGNVYQIITIGDQTWMAENLRTTHYSNGMAIENGSGIGDIEWEDQSKRFFHYGNDSANSENFGCLYSWYTAVNGILPSNSNPSGIQGVCPKGLYLPSDSEWNQLENEVGGENSAAASLKNYLENNILIYPNPCKNYIYINSHEKIIDKISIYSLDNKLIKSLQIQETNEISISDFNNGLYVIKIYFKNTIYTDELIIM